MNEIKKSYPGDFNILIITKNVLVSQSVELYVNFISEKKAN